MNASTKYKEYKAILIPVQNLPGDQNTQSDSNQSHQVAHLDQAQKRHTEAVQGHGKADSLVLQDVEPVSQTGLLA